MRIAFFKNLVISLLMGSMLGGLPWIVLVDTNFLNRFGHIIATILAWGFMFLSVPGMAVAVMIAGDVHPPSILIIIVTNSVFYSLVIYHVLSRLQGRGFS